MLPMAHMWHVLLAAHGWCTNYVQLKCTHLVIVYGIGYIHLFNTNIYKKSNAARHRSNWAMWTWRSYFLNLIMRMIPRMFGQYPGPPHPVKGSTLCKQESLPFVIGSHNLFWNVHIRICIYIYIYANIRISYLYLHVDVIYINRYIYIYIWEEL